MPGHSTASIAQGEEAVRNGASFITHLFNAMLPVQSELHGILTNYNLHQPLCSETNVFYSFIIGILV